MIHESVERSLRLLVDPTRGFASDPDIVRRCVQAMRQDRGPDAEQACLAAVGRRLAEPLCRLLRGDPAASEAVLRTLLEGELAEIGRGGTTRTTAAPDGGPLDEIDDAIDEALRRRCRRDPISTWDRVFLAFDESIRTGESPDPIRIAMELADGGAGPVDPRTRRRRGLSLGLAAPADPVALLYRIDPAVAAELEGPYTAEDRRKREGLESRQRERIKALRKQGEEFAKGLDELERKRTEAGAKGRTSSLSRSKVQKAIDDLHAGQSGVRENAWVLPEESEEEVRRAQIVVQRLEAEIERAAVTPTPAAATVADAGKASSETRGGSRRSLVVGGFVAVAAILLVVAVWWVLQARAERRREWEQSRDSFRGILEKGTTGQKSKPFEAPDLATLDGCNRIVPQLETALGGLPEDGRSAEERQLVAIKKFVDRLAAEGLEAPERQDGSIADLPTAKRLAARQARIRSLLGVDAVAKPWKTRGEPGWETPWEAELAAIGKRLEEFLRARCEVEEVPAWSVSRGSLESDLSDARLKRARIAEAIGNRADLIATSPGIDPDPECGPRLEANDAAWSRRIAALDAAKAVVNGEESVRGSWSSPEETLNSLSTLLAGWTTLCEATGPSGQPGVRPLERADDWKRSFLDWQQAVDSWNRFCNEHGPAFRGGDQEALRKAIKACEELKAAFERIGTNHELETRRRRCEELLRAAERELPEPAAAGDAGNVPAPPLRFDLDAWVESESLSLDAMRSTGATSSSNVRRWLLRPASGGVAKFELVDWPGGAVKGEGWPPWPFPILREVEPSVMGTFR